MWGGNSCNTNIILFSSLNGTAVRLRLYTVCLTVLHMTGLLEPQAIRFLKVYFSQQFIDTYFCSTVSNFLYLEAWLIIV